MRSAVVIDTNVPVVANGGTEQAGPDCVIACIDALENAMQKGPILLDDMQRIFDEYRRYLSFSGQPGPGDRFVKWLWANQSNTQRCQTVAITPRDGNESDFEEFPVDAALVSFDRDDRKFVAVAISSGLDPAILNASDTDWWNSRRDLARHGIRLKFLCPELMTGGG